jgi:enoyl-CoA hydratase/carnithine racemase
MSFELLRLESDGRVSTLTLVRPELLNAMSYEAVLELTAPSRRFGTTPPSACS